MQVIPRITPCLWFDDQAEEAARFYTAIFRNSKIVSTNSLRRSREGDPRKTGGERHDRGI